MYNDEKKHWSNLKEKMDFKNQIDKVSSLKKWLKKRNWFPAIASYSLTLIITYFLLSVVDKFFPTFYFDIQSNPNSARYLLSSLIQSQAAILAIVLTITLIAVQLAASSYSARVIEIFKKNIDFIIILLLYGASIFIASGILKIIPEDIETFKNQIGLQSKINLALFLSVFTFASLYPYMSRTLNLLKPSTIVEVITNDIKKENFFNQETENNPFIPIFDIIRGSFLKFDFETTRKGLTEIEIKGVEILQNELSKSDKEKIVLSISNELESFGILAVNMGEDEVAEKTVKILRSISKTINEEEQYKSVSRINYYFKVIGSAAIEKKFLRTPQEAIKSIYDIGKDSLKINSKVSEQSTLLLGGILK